MKKHLLIFFLLNASLHSTAQSVFQKICGGTGDDYFGSFLEQTSDSGYILTGVRNIFTGGGIEDVSLMKVNSNGNLLWAKTYGGSGYESGKCVKQTSDGG